MSDSHGANGTRTCGIESIRQQVAATHQNSSKICSSPDIPECGIIPKSTQEKAEIINQDMTVTINTETLDAPILNTPETQEPFILTNCCQEYGASRTESTDWVVGSD